MNSVEHLAWTMPTLLLAGLFAPRTTLGLGVVMLGGRELYRMGYQTSDGPNSKIREMGAIPLNIAELLMVIGVSCVALKYRVGPFIARRKIV